MKWKKHLYFLFSFLLFVIIWQLSVSLLNLNQTLFPSPIKVLLSLSEPKEILADLTISLARLATGATVGILGGVIFGLLTGKLVSLNNTIGKLANFFRFIPPLALVPLFLVWFGIGELSKISLLAWTAFFPVWVNVHNGVKNIENKYVLVAKSLGINKKTFITDVILKGSMDYILTGSRIGIGIAFSVLIAAEMLGAYVGMGYRISFLQSFYRVDRMIGYIIIVGILGLVVDKMFLVASRKLTPWKNET